MTPLELVKELNKEEDEGFYVIDDNGVWWVVDNTGWVEVGIDKPWE